VPIPASEVDRRVAVFSETLRRSGLRLTHQRLEVLREIAATDEHPDVETIYRGVRERVPTISIDTVYRTLSKLAEVGLVKRVTATSGLTRYDANTLKHHHFVCVHCGLVRDVDSGDLDAVRAPRQTAELGTVESVEVQLKGVCRQCAERQSQESA
jgi:Fur family transcriptional regulator, peroxide stress response regulator